MSTRFRFLIFAALLCGSSVVGFGCANGSGDGDSEMPAVTTTLSGADGTSIDRRNLPSGAAPGDGSGQGKTPEGNTNSGDSANTSVAGTVSR
jgi:hypothetical protein